MKKYIFLYLGFIPNLFAQQTLLPSSSFATYNSVLAYQNQTPSFTGRFAGGSSVTPTATPNGAVLMRFGAIGYNGTTFNSTPSGSIEYRANGLFSTSNQGAGIHLFTTSNSTNTQQERMTIAHNGNVGIGSFSTTPETKLHIMSSSTTKNISPYTLLTLEDANNTYISLLAGTNVSDVGGIVFGSTLGQERGFLNYNNSFDSMKFKVENTDKMTLLANGDVGINTVVPQTKLDVNGDFRVNRRLYIDDSQTWHNLNRSNSSIIKVGGGSTVTVTGIAGGVDGMIVKFYVIASTNLTILANNSNSSAENRIAKTVSISQGGGITLIYDGDAQLWRVVGFNP